MSGSNGWDRDDEPTGIRRLRESMRDTPTGRGLLPIEAAVVEMQRSQRGALWKMVGAILGVVGLPAIGLVFYLGRSAERLEDGAQQTTAVVRESQETQRILVRIGSGIDAIREDVGEIRDRQKETDRAVTELRRELDKQGGEARRRR